MGMQQPREKHINNPLTTDEILSLLKHARELGAKVLAISGEGEPLLDVRFKKIVSTANDLGFIPFVASNGRLLSPDTISFLIENNASITISLDTLDPKDYDEKCGVAGSLPNVLGNIETARRLFAEKIRCENGFRVMQCGIHTTLSVQDIGEIRKMQDFCGDSLYLSIGLLAEGVKNDLILKRAAIESIDPELLTPLLLTSAGNGRSVCGFFYYGLSIGFDGSILLDVHALETGGKLQNIRDIGMEGAVKLVRSAIEDFYSLPDADNDYCIVRSKRYQSFVQSIGRGEGK